MSHAPSDPLIVEADLPAQKQPAGRQRMRLPWWLAVPIALVVIVVFIVALGGFRDVPIRTLPLVPAGETYVGGAASVTVVSASLVHQRPQSDFDTTEPGEVYVSVTARLENQTDAPSNFAYDSLRVAADAALAPETAPDGVYDLRDGSVFDDLQPGLPAEVVVQWTVDEDGLSEGDEIAVGIFDRIEVENDPIFGDTRYRTTAVARTLLTLDAEPRQAAP